MLTRQQGLDPGPAWYQPSPARSLAVLSASFKTALHSLGAHRLRSTLTVLGIVIGIAAVIVMISVGNGAQEQIARQIRSLGANVIGISPGSIAMKSVRLGAGTASKLSEDDAAAIESEVSGILAVAPALYTRAQFTFGSTNWAGNIRAVTPAYFVARDWSVAAGRELTWEDNSRSANVVLLGETVRRKLFRELDPVDVTIRISGIPFKIIGVLQPKGLSVWGEDQDDVVLMPLRTARLQLVGVNLASPRQVHGISVKFADSASPDPIMSSINELLRQRHRLQPGEEDSFIVRNLNEVAGAERTATDALSTLLAAIASVSLLVGGIGIMNIMLVSVTERTREIGLRLAVGARERDIVCQFLVEAVTLTAGGGLLGVFAGVLASDVLARLAGWPVLLDLSSLVLSVGVAGAIGIFFGYYPAHRAARLDPIAALGSE